jgi:regulator of sigma E protease
VNFSWLDLPAFLVAVCLLVTVHEFGHYWVARKLGFKVLRFSVGFGRPLWRRVAGADQTEYVVAAVPLGGYVKLLDEREGPVAPQELSRAFTQRPHWQRIAVLLAGPAFNFIFAILVLAGMFWAAGLTELRPVIGTVVPGSHAERAGLRVGDEVLAVDSRPLTNSDDVMLALMDGVSADSSLSVRVLGSNGLQRDLAFNISDSAERRRLSDPEALLSGIGLTFQLPIVPAVLGVVDSGGPADRAGIKSGDRLLEINGVRVQTFSDIAAQLAALGGKTATVRVRRADGEHLLPVQVAAETVNGKVVGRIHVRPQELGQGFNDQKLFRHTSLGPVAALGRASARAWDLTALQARLMWRMALGNVSVKNLSGPLSIAQMAGESARAGGYSFLSYLVIISLALGFMNLLPIPILDGGQIVMQTVEWVKGSPLSERVQVAGQQVGIMLVMLLLGLALYNDIARQFS